MPGVMKGASVSKRSPSGTEGELLEDDGDGDGVELSCEGKEGGKNGCDSDAHFQVGNH